MTSERWWELLNRVWCFWSCVNRGLQSYARKKRKRWDTTTTKYCHHYGNILPHFPFMCHLVDVKCCTSLAHFSMIKNAINEFQTWFLLTHLFMCHTSSLISIFILITQYSISSRSPFLSSTIQQLLQKCHQLQRSGTYIYAQQTFYSLLLFSEFQPKSLIAVLTQVRHQPSDAVQIILSWFYTNVRDSTTSSHTHSSDIWHAYMVYVCYRSHTNACRAYVYACVYSCMFYTYIEHVHIHAVQHWTHI